MHAGRGKNATKYFQRGNATFTVALCSSIRPKVGPFAKYEIICTLTVSAQTAVGEYAMQPTGNLTVIYQSAML